MYDIIIVGGGPAGLTAAIYARRNGRNVLLLEKEGFGGQMAFAPRVENYPGVEPVEGAALAERMLGQVLAVDTDTDVGTVCALHRKGDRWTAETEEGDAFSARAVILCCGARHRTLGLPGEHELLGRGVSYCAVCDGSFYKDGAVAVVGGGDSAMQEALLLSDLCRRVYLIHRRDAFRGDAEKLSRLRSRENVELLTPMTVSSLLERDGALSGLRLKNAETGGETSLFVDALFISVGQVPELGAFADVAPLDDMGYAVAGEEGELPAPGLFVAGDCRTKTVRQIATAVSDGANAAMSACRYLEGLSEV